MRKVYHTPGSQSNLALSVAIGLAGTAILFCALPFTHIVNKPSRTLELRKAAVADLPPPAEEEPPPPPPEDKSEDDAPPEPQLAETPQHIPLSADLDLAVGTGGALAGFGEVRALAAAEGIQEEALDIADLDNRPEPVFQAPPTYPAELRKARIEGVVTVVFMLDESGRVDDARVENSSRPEFEKPALEAIRKWRFKPGMKDGQPVRTFVRIPMRFRVTSG